MAKEQASLLASNEDDHLFGKPFRKHVMDIFKEKKESAEVCKSTDGKKQPFLTAVFQSPVAHNSNQAQR